MTFNPNTPLDPGQVTDRRGMGGRGGLAVGGGGIGLVILLAYVLLGGNPNDLGPLLEPGAVEGPGGSAVATDCKTGQDANARDDCRILGYVNSVQKYWTEEFTASGLTYQPVDTVLFSGVTQSGCGTATSATGPFYCPVDTLVYLDLTFFQELRTRFGASGGSLAQGYVIAHEYGHHVQDLLEVLQGGTSQEGAEGRSVRIELQADCFAGVWADSVRDRGLFDNPQEVEEALNAAAAVGDDRIQQKTQGRVDPESFTHGTSAQRVAWFKRGFDTGDPNRCTTFSEVL